MYYNEGLFDTYNVPYPEVGWTWDDFLEAALEIRDPDADVFGCVVEPSSFAFPLVYQHGGQLLDDWENPTRATFDDPLAIEALEWYVDLMDRDGAILTQRQSRELYGGEMYGGVYRAKVGTWADSLSVRGGEMWERKWPLEWGVVPLPRDRKEATLGFVQAYAISAQAQHPKACWQWITFLSRQIPPHLMPARRSIAESAAYEEQVGAEVAAAARASIENALIVSAVQLEIEQALSSFTRAVQDVIDGKATAEEAMIRAQRQSRP